MGKHSAPETQEEKKNETLGTALIIVMTLLVLALVPILSVR